MRTRFFSGESEWLVESQQTQQAFLQLNDSLREAKKFPGFLVDEASGT
jgi:hypothetical protein